jgi:hypothetical protein
MSYSLLGEARNGYNAGMLPNIYDQRNPYLATSPSHMAWAIGRWMAQTGRSMPFDCRPSRGMTMHINNMKVRVNYIQGCAEIERIA